MTLTELLAAHPPKPASAYSAEQLATLRNLWLVMPVELSDYLVAEHQAHGNPVHVPQPVSLTDGRRALCADLLTEITTGGLYSLGFEQLVPESFVMVDVLTTEEFTALLPQPEGDLS